METELLKQIIEKQDEHIQYLMDCFHANFNPLSHKIDEFESELSELKSRLEQSKESEDSNVLNPDVNRDIKYPEADGEYDIHVPFKANKILKGKLIIQDKESENKYYYNNDFSGDEQSKEPDGADEINEEQFAKIKFEIAKIQFNYLTLNEDKTHIEANPSTHRIAEYVCGLLSDKQKKG